MKKMLFALLAASMLVGFSCTKENNQILVRFHNTLPDDLSGTYFYFDDDHQTIVGDIPAGQTTGYIAFDYFQEGSGVPMGFLKGVIYGDVDFSAWSGMWCGTGVEFKQLEPGEYTVRITKVSDEFYQILFEE